MWPLLLDMTKDESYQSLRNLELEAYSHLVSALRAQGSLSSEKRKLLKETGNALNISQERHKAEIRRALNDEKLSTIAYHVSGPNECSDDWAQEGRRVIPLIPRMAPQTAFSSLADEIADNADQNNKQLPLPANTERKRSVNQSNLIASCSESIKPNTFRIPDTPKHEELKKRKHSESGSSLAQHLLGPSKMSKIQQIYRQKTKLKSREQFAKMKSELESPDLMGNKIQHPLMLQKSQPSQVVKVPVSTPLPTLPSNGSKIHILQNLNLQQPSQIIDEETSEQIYDVNNFAGQKCTEQNFTQSIQVQNNVNENNQLKFLSKANNNIMLKSLPTATASNFNVDLQKLKVCPARKQITKTVPTTGQKLIVVSSAQNMPPSSILQRTLTIPFVKNISVKNFDKFKIVSTTATPINMTNSLVNTNNFNSVKHKVVTVRTTNPVTAGKKGIPLTHLQMLNKGNIKVLPIGGKILGKTTATTSSPMYFVNTVGNSQASNKCNNLSVSTKMAESIENVNSTLTPTTEGLDISSIVDADKMVDSEKNSPINKDNIPVTEDYDTNIDEFHIQTVPLHSHETVIEVQSENEVKPEETDGIEIDKSRLISLSDIDCFISQGDIMDSEKKFDFENSSREKEVEEIEESTKENFKEVIVDSHVDLLENQKIVQDIGYIAD